MGSDPIMGSMPHNIECFVGGGCYVDDNQAQDRQKIKTKGKELVDFITSQQKRRADNQYLSGLAY